MSLAALLLALQAGSGLLALEEGRFEEAARLLRAEPSPSYASLVGLGVAEARLGRPEAAQAALARAIAMDATRGEAFVERGGLRFLEQRYAEAALDLERALARGEDAHARELLAATLQLLGRTDEALASWNRLGGPTLRRVEIAGLRHTKDQIARREITLREGERLELDEVRESRRRLEETGVFESVSVRTRPRGDGTADVEVALLERHGFASSPTELAASTLGQLADRRIGLRYANLGGIGASAGASWRFAEGRPEIALGLEWPRPLGLDANLRLLARRGRQGYLFEEPVERTSRGFDLSLRRVLGARTVAELAFSFRDRSFSAPSPSAVPGLVAGPRIALERRLVEGGRQRLEAGVRLFGAHPAAGSELAFLRGVLSLRYELALGDDAEASSLHVRGLYGAGSDGLPLDEGFLPGAGPESPYPLRAHRQFEDGAAGGTPLGRSLLLFNMEWRRLLAVRGSLRLEVAGFYDAARPWRGLESPRWLHDVGFGIRLGVHKTTVRLDFGHGLADGSNALTLGVGQAF